MDPTDDVSDKRAELERCPPGHNDRDHALNKLAEALYDRFRAEGKMDDMEEAIALYREALELCPSGHPDRSSSFRYLALCLLDRCDNQGVVADLGEAVIRGRATLELHPTGDSNQDASFHNLARDLRTRFREQAAVQDLDWAIKLNQAVLELRPSGHSHHSSSLRNLALCLSDRYKNRGAVADLEEAITLGRAALELCPPGHRDRDTSLHNLARDLGTRFRKRAAMQDLDEAIKLNQAALELRPSGHPHRSSSLCNLALCLSDRYEIRRMVTDLKEAIKLGRAALELCPPGHRDRDTSLHNLARDLRTRFRKQAAVQDLDEAIQLNQAALELRPSGNPHRPSSLRNLALCLSDKYENQGVITDLEEAITLGRAALELCPPGHSDRDVSLKNLTRNLRVRFQKEAGMQDLGELIELHREALGLRPSGHPHRSSALRNLAQCLSYRYKNQGAIDDLTEAITLGRAALDLCPPGHRDRDTSLHNLARDLGMRFRKQAAIQDLGEAIKLNQAALELRPSGHPHRSSSLRNLALCLSDKYEKQGVITDLEEAIRLGRAALELRPPVHSDRDESLINLARNLRMRFQKESGMQDLDEAIELHREALGLRPTGHPHRYSSLRNLTLCLSHRYKNRGAVTDLEEAIKLGRAALELRPPGHSDRNGSLNNLTYYLQKTVAKQAVAHGSSRSSFPRRAASVPRPPSYDDGASLFHVLSLLHWDKFQKQAAVADLDEAIYLATYASELRLPKDRDYAVSVEKLNLFISERVKRMVQGTYSAESAMLGRTVDHLCALGHYLRDRFRNQHAIPDLNEAIILHEFLLQLCPAEHVNHPSCLHDLALCLIDRFHATAIVGNLDEAIKREQKALELSTPSDPSCDIYRDHLATYRHMKIRLGTSTVSSIRSVSSKQFSEAIRRVIFKTLETMPPRLLNTQTGTLCSRNEQISHFTSGPQYNRLKQLLSSAMSYDTVEQDHRIQASVSKYFRFVMFSHRWGDGEPSLRDIQGHAIYDMASSAGGVKKLQEFCATALKQDYLWAWSDTCCIDKDSSVELQEAIGSMFEWYRQSALTIVYLADVPETGSLATSQWFKRGWTLQELLAPRTLLFYTQSWSLYKNTESSNHKKDAAILGELGGVTGIESRFLTDFSPGMDDARSRLQWASSRRTTRPEDVAYSLFGIFNLHLPVLYGESSEFALGRLLGEVISQSGDVSMLDWIGEASTFHSCFPIRITSYQPLPLAPVPQAGAEEQSLTASQPPASSKALRKLYRSLIKSPLPRFVNRRLTLSCFSYRVTSVELQRANPSSSSSYTYAIQAFGLKPLEITVPAKLDNATMENVAGSLQLVRPSHLKLLGGSTKLDVVAAEQLLVTLGGPFNALLLTELPHNAYKRIASSTLIVAQPVDSPSILQSKIRILNLV